MEYLFTQKQPQSYYITLKHKNRPWWNHSLNLTTNWSSNVYNNTINIAHLLRFEVIIFKSGFQTFEQACMCIYERGHFFEA